MTEGSEHALSISVAEPSDGVFVVSLVGELEATSSDELSRQLAGLRGNARTRVVVDVSGLTFIDSSGLNALVMGARAVEANEGSLVVAGAPRYVARVLELVRMADSVEVEASVEEALRRAGVDPA
ncbi:MAG: STAS domain-containing protein, partial [Actinomycetota bacterium]|nr:STAS domain-containing protein [Actinomycetota bacterium]